MKGSWGYSEGGERYQCGYDSREEAIEEGRECCEGDFFVAQGMKPSPVDFVPDADHIIEEMQERAADSEGGDWSEDWLKDVPKEAQKELESIMAAWAEKNCPVTWWVFGMIGTPETIEHEPEDV